MNASVATRTGSGSRSFAGRVAPALSPCVRQLASVARRNGWECHVLGQAPLPTKPVRLGDWWLVPAHLDSSPIPARALERVQSIYAAGGCPKGFVVVHEAPKLLEGPQRDTPRRMRMSLLPSQLRSKFGVAGAGLAIAGLAAVVVPGLIVLALAAMALAAAVAVPALFLVAVAVVDPILVAVTDDGYWVEIDRWDT